MTHHLAQLNIARFRLPTEHRQNANFLSNLDRVSILARVQGGVVWRFIEGVEGVIESRENTFTFKTLIYACGSESIKSVFGECA